MTHPDGGIGFFNDAAHGIAPTFSQLDQYADELGLTMPYAASQGPLYPVHNLP